jgi:hypothetical protein
MTSRIKAFWKDYHTEVCATKHTEWKRNQTCFTFTCSTTFLRLGYLEVSPGKAAQWLARSIRESRGVLWLVIRLLSVRADVSSSVIKAWEHLYCIPLHTCQHAGALPATTCTSTPCRRTVTSKYSSFTFRFTFKVTVLTSTSKRGMMSEQVVQFQMLAIQRKVYQSLKVIVGIVQMIMHLQGGMHNFQDWCCHLLEN